MIKTSAQVQKIIGEYVNYISSIKPGTQLTWKQIQNDTKIRSSERNKNFFRRALHKCNIAYEPMHGRGIVFSFEGNASRIMVRSVSRIDSGIKRAHKTHEKLMTHYDKLESHEQQAFNFAGGALGFLRSMTRKGIRSLSSPQTFNYEPSMPSNFKDDLSA